MPELDFPCSHPFVKKTKCVFCGVRLSKALLEYKKYKEIEQ